MAQITASSLAVPFDTASEESNAIEGDWIGSPQEKLRELCIPAPRPRIAARIDDLAELIGGGSEPLYCGPRNLLVGTRLPRARMIIVGTACRRPLLRAEARELQAITGDHIVVLRLEDGFDRPVGFTCDFLHAVTGEYLEHLSPWKQPRGSSLWLAPADPSGVWIRLFEDGAQFCRALSNDHAEIESGFETARNALPAGGPGWQHG